MKTLGKISQDWGTGPLRGLLKTGITVAAPDENDIHIKILLSAWIWRLVLDF